MKPSSRYGRVLYFTKGSAVPEEDRDAGYAIAHNVGFRNASMPIGDTLEDCDAVAGYPPARYAKEYFTVTTADELAAAVQARKEGRKPEVAADDDDEPEIVDLGNGTGTEVDLTGKSEDYKSGFEAGKVRADYGDPAKVSDDFKAGYAEGLKLAPASKPAKAPKKDTKAKAAKANTPPKPAPAAVPKWGANT